MALRRAGRRLGPGLAVVAALTFALGLGAVAPVPATARDETLPAWTGRVDLFRSSAFTTQQSWLWCTAAGVQIVRNIVERDDDHSTASQRTYFSWMRRHNRYDLPESAGVDPAGWTAGLRHFVDDRYRLVASRSFGTALRSAVTRIRQTGLPVALTVANGGHGWILSGFTATADPALGPGFEVTSVRVVGPLYGLQSKNGYDMKPGTSLTVAQLRRFFTPWRYAPLPMIWDGRYVSIQPVPVKAAPAAPAPTPSPSPSPTAAPTATPGPTSPPPSAPPTGVPGPIAAGEDVAGPSPATDPAALVPAAVADERVSIALVSVVAGVLALVVFLWRRPARRTRG